jgi:hypothetical protein
VRTQACAAAAPFREAVDVMTALYGARSMYRRSGPVPTDSDREYEAPRYVPVPLATRAGYALL